MLGISIHIFLQPYFCEESQQGMCETCFFVCWASIYPGYPDKVKVYQESVLTSKEWRQLSADAGIEVEFSGVESHNAIGVGELYQSPLRRIYLKIREDAPSLDPDISLKLAVKSMNDTLGPEGLVPSLLKFGVVSRFPLARRSFTAHVEGMEAINVIRIEMASISARLRLQQARRSKLTPATSYKVSPGDRVYVYGERMGGQKVRGKWKGPYEVTKNLDKVVYVARPDKEAQLSIDHIFRMREAVGAGLVHHVFHALGTKTLRRLIKHQLYCSKNIWHQMIRVLILPSFYLLRRR